MSTSFENAVKLPEEFVPDAPAMVGIPTSTNPYIPWKSAIERMTAAILLVPGLPLMALLILLVRLTSKGPGIYKQVRVGFGGAEYTMYKIRTMSADAESKTGAVWTQSCDPRITRFGQLLRSLHLDEIPQLFNVLKGEMSLIGPRPERPEFVTVLAQQIPGYANRLAVRPGITGLAQINLPPDSDLDSVRRKQVLDLEYIDTCGLWLDVRIIASTFLRMFGLRHGIAVRWFGVNRKVELLSDMVAETTKKNAAPTPDSLIDEYDSDTDNDVLDEPPSQNNWDTKSLANRETIDEGNIKVAAFFREHRKPR